MRDAPSLAETHTALYLQSTRLTLSRAVAKYMPAIMLRSAHILALQIYHTLPPHHANHAPCVMIMNAQYEASPPLSPWRENPFTIESGQVHIWTNQLWPTRKIVDIMSGFGNLTRNIDSSGVL